MTTNNDISLTITRKRIKHLYLRIDDNGSLRVSAPIHMSEHDIMAFITEKHGWIAQKQAKQQAKSKHNKDILTLFGNNYPITRQQSSRNHITLSNAKCVMELKKNDAEHSLVIAYYRAQLMQVLIKFVSHYTPIIGATPNEIRTKNMKTKWGTCNIHAKRLWFNVQLARYPEAWVEYVVVHEMVHLLEPSHNARFYRLVENAMPNWKVYHDALRHI